ncbi:MAG: hypothetical protein ABL949_13150 [Fimbriimonadaceae bacterium]
MKKALIGITVLAAIGAGGFVGYEKFLKKAPLERGTEVKLILMQQVEAGKDKEGDIVRFLVAEDVLAKGGGIAVPKGTLVKGKVSQSRGENMFSSLTNKPARLELQIDGATLADGQTLKLGVEPNGPLDQPLSLNRANTGRQNISEKLKGIATDPDVMAALSQIEGSFRDGGKVDLSNEATKKGFEKIAKELNMKNLQEAVLGDKVADVNSVLDSTKRAGNVLNDPLAIGAVLELANIAGEVGSKLGRMLSGRKIVAYPGTPISMYVGESIQVHPR